MSERDTHFQGFAKLLWDELEDMERDDFFRDFSAEHLAQFKQKRIAQRAYDLVWHTIHAIGLDDDSIPFQDIYRPEEDIPDLTKWPDHS